MWSEGVWSREDSVIVDCIDPDHGAVFSDAGDDVELLGDVARTEPGGCCQEVRVSSLDMGDQYQERRMTVYRWSNISRPSMNSYPVYTADNGESLYLWDWGVGQGMNWFMSDNVSSNMRGVESPDLEFKDNKCPELVNIDKFVDIILIKYSNLFNLEDPGVCTREEDSSIFLIQDMGGDRMRA